MFCSGRTKIGYGVYCTESVWGYSLIHKSKSGNLCKDFVLKALVFEREILFFFEGHLQKK